MIPIVDNEGRKTNATALTALAAKAADSDTVQVRQQEIKHEFNLLSNKPFGYRYTLKKESLLVIFVLFFSECCLDGFIIF